jgi:serine/threonine-protein kinase
MIGITVSHYTIVEKLGEGGMGVVYRARDTRLRRFVALKFLPPHIGPEDQESLRFLQEAEAASGLDHPNICTIHDVGQTDEGRTFIVMAYYEGETLQKRIARGAIPLSEAVAIAEQVASGLGRAHANGIVHRDVKPANIMLTRDAGVKVLDFGVARLLGATSLTGPGTAIGTIGYMAPEQVRGEPADQRADVWALGIVLYVMLAGTAPFGGDNPATVINAVLNARPRPIETFDPTCRCRSGACSPDPSRKTRRSAMGPRKT